MPDDPIKPIDLSALRGRIDAIDERILDALAERRDVSRAVIEAKARGEVPLRDERREEELLVRLIRTGRTVDLDGPFVTRVFHQIIDDSVRLQQEILQDIVNDQRGNRSIFRVAFLGIEGSYSHLAGRQFFARRAGDPIDVPSPTFDDVVRAVERGEADYGLLPIENTTSGGINEVYDLLLHTRLSIVGEHKLRVDHSLLGLPGADPSAVRCVFTHPQPAVQCSSFLAGKPWKIEYTTDTASSVQQVRDAGDPTISAIAGSEAARTFGLEVLVRDIANQTENWTRFLVVGPKPIAVDVRIPAKTSLVMSTSQRPGSLVEALLVFRDEGLNLTKLESRPVAGNPWEQMFYVDLQGNIAEARVERAMERLEEHTRIIKVLGTYPSDDLPPTNVDDT